MNVQFLDADVVEHCDCGETMQDRPSTKVHAAPGGGSSLGYLFGGKWCEKKEERILCSRNFSLADNVIIFKPAFV